MPDGRSIKAWLIWAALLAVAHQSNAAEPVSARSPITVVALVAPDETGVLFELADATQKALPVVGYGDVLGPALTASLLAEGGHAGPVADLERLQGLFQQGYLQSYSFEYRKALSSLQQVLLGLRRLPPDETRWNLWIKTKIFEGMCHSGLRDEAAALRSFATVLRTRSKMELPRRDYSPKTIRLWEKARSRMPAIPLGQIAIESEPEGAQVFIDGVEIGKTPYIGRFPQGRYHLNLRHETAGRAVRWVELSKLAARIRLQLSFEGSLVLDKSQPAVRLAKGQDDLPVHWWSWLGARLGIRHLIAVRRGRADGGQTRYLAALVDLESGRKLREGWVLVGKGPGDGKPRSLDSHALDLARFLITGQASERMQVEHPREPRLIELAVVPQLEGALSPELPVIYSRRPWFRTWWTYALASAALLGGGTGAHLAAEHYDRQAARATNALSRSSLRDQGDAWLGGAIGLYSLAGLSLLSGIVVHLTWEPQEVFEEPLPLSPIIHDHGGVGLIWTFRM